MAAIRKWESIELTDCTPRNPVPGGVTGPERNKVLHVHSAGSMDQLTIETGHTVHVLRSVFEHSLPHVVFLHTVHRSHLDPPPPHGQNEGIPGFE